MSDIPALGKYPRAELYSDATILEPMERLGSRLGVNLFIKRDDTLPLAMGGNKVRQLEFYLGEAVSAGADTVLITGAIQSNFVRLCAAGARKLGMRPVVQLEKRVPKDSLAYNTSGNVLLLNMLGAEIVDFPEGENEALADAHLDSLADQLRAEGANPYVVHLGVEHPPIGGLGYVAAAVETIQQSNDMNVAFDHIVLPSGSGLTHAGFLAGMRLMQQDVDIQGICVRRTSSLQKNRVLRRANEVGMMLGYPNIIEMKDVNVDDTCLNPGYGRMNDQVAEALQLSAVEEGILMDPVYSGRTLAGLMYLIRIGKIASGKNILFIHTGGVPANFGYQSDLETLHA